MVDGSLRRENLDETEVGGLVGARPDVGRMLLRRVVLAEGGLDAALRLRGVAGLERALRHERYPSPAASALTAAARPDAPEPTTRTSNASDRATTAGL